MPNEVVVIDSADEFENGSGDEFEEDNDDEMELAMLDSKLAQIQAKIDVLVDQKVRKVLGLTVDLRTLLKSGLENFKLL